MNILISIVRINWNKVVVMQNIIIKIISLNIKLIRIYKASNVRHKFIISLTSYAGCIFKAIAFRQFERHPISSPKVIFWIIPCQHGIQKRNIYGFFPSTDAKPRNLSRVYDVIKRKTLPDETGIYNFFRKAGKRTFKRPVP